MSLLRRIENSDDGNLLRLLLEKLHNDRRLQDDIEALLNDDSNNIHLTDEEHVQLKADPVDFLQQIAQRRSLSHTTSRHRPISQKQDTSENTDSELRKNIIESIQTDDEFNVLVAKKDYEAVHQRIEDIMNISLTGQVISRSKRQRLFAMITQELVGFGPLEPLFNDPLVVEIRVLGPDQIWVNRTGRLEKIAYAFDDHQHLLRIIHRFVTYFGVTLDDTDPFIEFKTSEGSRVTIMLPPLSPAGAVVMIKKHKYGSYLASSDLVRMGTVPKEALHFLSLCVKEGLNVLITGAAVSGMTTFMVVLGNMTPNDHFIVVVNGDLEVGGLQQEQVVYLQTYPFGQDQHGKFNQAQLIQQAAEISAERVLVDDLEGNAINEIIRTWTPWLATMRAHSVEAALSKIETVTRLVRDDNSIIPMRIAESVDLVVHMERLRSGARRVGRICEVLYTENGLALHDIFALEIMEQKFETHLRFMKRPVGEQFKLKEINTLFEQIS